MSAYLNSVVVTAVVCHIVTVLSVECDSAKRYVRLLCALVTLLTLVSPIKHVVEGADGIIEQISDFFSSSATTEQLPAEGTDDIKSLAYVIMRAVSDKFDIDEKNIRITLITDESGELSEIQLYLASTAYADRERVRESLEGEFEIPVYVFAMR